MNQHLPKHDLSKKRNLLSVLFVLALASTIGCASSLYPVRTTVEKKESIALFINKIESNPAYVKSTQMARASKSIAEYDALLDTLKQSLQKELPGSKVVEPKTTKEEILGQSVFMYDFGGTNSKIGIEFIPATTYTIESDSEFHTTTEKNETWKQETKVTIRFREINGNRMGKYLGSRFGYTLATVTESGRCDGTCQKNANALVEISKPAKHVPSLKSQIPENLKKVIQEIMASEP